MDKKILRKLLWYDSGIWIVVMILFIYEAFTNKIGIKNILIFESVLLFISLAVKIMFIRKK